MSGSNEKNSQTRSSADEIEASDAALTGSPTTARRRQMNWICFLLVAGLAAGVATFKRGPQTASAAGQASAGAATSFDALMGAQLPAIRDVDGALLKADQAIEEFKFVPAKVQVPLTELKVNPFRRKGSASPVIDSREDTASRDTREQERQAAMHAVQSLRLESISRYGPARACMINSVRYQEGQEAAGFLVEEIAANTVVVRKGAYRFELKPSM